MLQKNSEVKSIRIKTHQSARRYFLLSISSSGSCTSVSFFFFSRLMTDRAIIGLPFLFSLSIESSSFCFRCFSYSISSSFFSLFRILFSVNQSFSNSLIKTSLSLFAFFRSSSCFSMLSSISFKSYKAETCF